MGINAFWNISMHKRIFKCRLAVRSPTQTIEGVPVKTDSPWSTEDITEIKFSSRRAVPTAIQWWQTSQGHPIAIMGNELGEISFVNLELRKEVGGTYITVSITELELVYDAAATVNNTVYALITGSNDVQWQLVLEQRNGAYQYPLERSDVEKVKPAPGASSSSLLSCLSVPEDRLPPASAPTPKDKDLHPKRLIQYAGHTHLRPCHFRGKKYVSGYYASTGVLTLHRVDFNIVPLFVYKLPPDTQRFLLSDYLVFAFTKNEEGSCTLRAICVELAASSLDGSKGYDAETELQSFHLPSSSKGILGVVQCHSPAAAYVCLVITNCGVYSVRQRISVEEKFLELVLKESNYSNAEKLAKIMGKDVNVLYEKAAEVKLSEGQVSTAIRLYHMAKWPLIRSVANFVAYGHLSELLSYIGVLFTKSGMDFAPSDVKHFSNVALYCYLHQCLDLRVGGTLMLLRFRKFLHENQHYDEQVAIHLLVTYGFYDLLYELGELKGLFCHALDEILPNETRNEKSVFRRKKCCFDDDSYLRPCWADSEMAAMLSEHGFKELVSLDSNENFLYGLFHPHLPTFLGLNCDLMWRHLSFLKRVAHCWENNVDRLKLILSSYRPFNPALAPLFRQSARKRNISCGSVDFIDGNDFVMEADETSNAHQLGQELTEFFLKVLLRINNHFKEDSLFNFRLVVPSFHPPALEFESDSVVEEGKLTLPRRGIPLGAGFAHAGAIINGQLYTWGRNLNGCLGRGPDRRDWSPADCIPTTMPLLKVLSVSCGTAHTLLMTDIGVYGCGCNRYGQLGIGNHVWSRKLYHPTVIEPLSALEVAFVTCGQYHSLALTADGTVYSWGWGAHGQLGHGNPANVYAPQRIDALLDCSIIRASAGYAHSLFLSTKGEVFICGCGTFGQLGTGRVSKESVPVQIMLPEVVTLIAAGYFHNVAVSVSGRIFTWGCNPQTLKIRAQAARRAARQAATSAELSASSSPSAANAIDDPTLSPGVLTPVEVDSSNIAAQIIQVACGCNHSAVITCDGEAYSWGRNLDGQLGQEGRKERMVPAPIIRLNDRKVIHVICGCDFTLVLDDYGKIWGFGVDDCGQISGASVVDSEAAVHPTCGKIFKLRTGKRIIHVKPPVHSSVLQPVVLNGLPSATSTASLNAKLVSDEPVAKIPWQPCGQLWQDMNKTLFSDDVMHSAIEQLERYYDGMNVEESCLACNNFQAAGKVALLSGCVSRSFSHHLMAISQDRELARESKCSTALRLLEVFLQSFPDASSFYKPMLEAIIDFWSVESGTPQQLEEFFLTHLAEFLYPLCSTIFRCVETQNESDNKVQNLLSHLSSRFCLTLISGISENAKSGLLYPELLDLLADTAVHDKILSDKDLLPSETVSTDHLWSELMHNLKKDASGMAMIDLSSVEVRTLVKDVAGCDSATSVEVMLFTCGHHYPSNSFRGSVLLRVHEALAKVAPVNYQAVLSSYTTMGFQPTACPKCLLDGFQQEAA